MRLHTEWLSYLRALRRREVELAFRWCPPGVFANALELGAGDGYQASLLARYASRLVSTDYVMEQVYTALKVFGSLHAAQAVHELINNSALVRLFMVDSVIFERAWQVFVDDEHPRWTFTDCVNYSVIQYLGLSEVITFDPDFTAPDLAILPGQGKKE